MESVLNSEMIQYLNLLEEGFNPSSMEDLYALLYLIYYDYEYAKFSDPIFSRNLMNLVEQCKIAGCQTPHPQGDICNCPPPINNGQFQDNCNQNQNMGPIPHYERSALDFVQFGVQRLFYDGNKRALTDIFGRRINR